MAAASEVPFVTFDVLLIEGRAEERMHTKNRLESDPNLRVVADVSSADGARAYLRRHPVELIVIDDQLEGAESGLQVAGELRGIAPQAKIVLYSLSAGTDEQHKVIDAFVSKLQGEMLLPTIELLLGMDHHALALGRTEGPVVEWRA